MTDMVDTIADKLLGDHMQLMAENKSLREQLAAMTKERDGYAEACKELARHYETANPVAWKFTLDGVDQVVLDEDMDAHIYKNGIPLYTFAPPTPSVPMSEVKEMVTELLNGRVLQRVQRKNIADLIERLAGITKES